MKKAASIYAYGAMLLASASVAAPMQTRDASDPDPSHSSTAATEAAGSWLKALDLTIEAETVKGGMIVRRGYIAESELDQSMLPALHAAGLQHLMKLDEKDSGYRSPVEIAWFEPIEHPGTRCAALLQMVSLTRSPSPELRRALADYRVNSPPARLDANCHPVRYTDEQRRSLGYFQGSAGHVSADLTVRCADFRNRRKDRLTISRRTAFAHDIKHDSAKVSRAGNENIDGAGRWVNIGLNAGLNARDLPYMTYLNDGFTVAWPSNVALVSYILDGDASGDRCVALVATQGLKEWVGLIEVAKDDQLSPAASEAYQGGWDAAKPLERLGNQLATAIGYSTADD